MEEVKAERFKRVKRKCSRCEEWKPRAQFYPKCHDDFSDTSSMCRPCYNATYTTDYRRLLKAQTR